MKSFRDQTGETTSFTYDFDSDGKITSMMIFFGSSSAQVQYQYQCKLKCTCIITNNYFSSIYFSPTPNTYLFSCCPYLVARPLTILRFSDEQTTNPANTMTVVKLNMYSIPKDSIRPPISGPVMPSEMSINNP